MNLCIYLRPCQTATRFAGIGRYVRELSTSIVQVLSADDELTFLYDSRLPIGHLLEDAAFDTFSVNWVGVELGQLDDPLQSIYLSTVFDVLDLDWLILTHWFDEYAGVLFEASQFEFSLKTALVHYDLVPLVYPSEYLTNSFYRGFYHSRIEQMRDFDLICSISEFSQKDLSRLKLPSSVELEVIGSGADPNIFQYREHAPGDSGFVLCAPSGFDYRKHVEFLIEGYARLSEEIRAKYPLRIVGKIPAKRETMIHQLIERLGVKANIELIGFVLDEELIELYQAATVFVFPSRYEGFGLPVLEAIFCGTPAITSNQTSLPEVHGVDEALFDPERLETLTSVLTRVLKDSAFRRSIYDKQAAFATIHSSLKVATRLAGALHKFNNSSPKKVSDRPPSDSAFERLRVGAVSAGSVHESHRFAVLVADLDRQLRPLLRRRLKSKADNFSWTIEGHLVGPYSLAQVNRESALALRENGIPVSVSSHDGEHYHAPPRDFQVNDWHPSESVSDNSVAIHSRNVFPPKVSDFPDGVMRFIHHFAWEETGFPHRWAFEFNQHLDGVSCLSNLVQKVLIDHGVDIPLGVSGCGVRRFKGVKPVSSRVPAKDSGVFRFLHVSSCFPRKGVDVLLRAFSAAFQHNESVELVIKTFENPHNTVVSDVAGLRSQNPTLPSIRILMDEFSDAEMKALYQSADVLVSPSRAEGFGLPIFEAAEMLVPSIVTAWGGPMDLCDSETTWLLDFEFKAAKSHLPVYDSVWAEPDHGQLTKLLREVVGTRVIDRRERAKKLKARVDKQSRWSNVMNRHVDFATKLSATEHIRPRIGWVSTFGERCGVATYTEALVGHLRAPPSVVFARQGIGIDVSKTAESSDTVVVPSWDDNGFGGIVEAVRLHHLSAIVVQFAYPFYDYDALAELVAELSDLGCVLILELHESEPPTYEKSKHLKNLYNTLLLFDRILVHSVSAINDLKAVGITESVTLFPHGVKVLSKEKTRAPPAQITQRIAEARQEKSMQVIGSFGFFLPHKGFADLIQIVEQLCAKGMSLHLLLMTAEYPAPVSRLAIEEAERLIDQLGLRNNVTLMTDYLADEEVHAALKLCDLLVFPYRYTEQGASGAVRYGLSCDVPVVTSDLDFFDELGDCVRKLRIRDHEEMTLDLEASLIAVREKSPEIVSQLECARDWVRNHSYGILARRLYGMITGLSRLKRRKSYD